MYYAVLNKASLSLCQFVIHNLIKFPQGVTSLRDHIPWYLAFKWKGFIFGLPSIWEVKSSGNHFLFQKSLTLKNVGFHSYHITTRCHWWISIYSYEWMIFTRTHYILNWMVLFRIGPPASSLAHTFSMLISGNNTVMLCMQ